MNNQIKIPAAINPQVVLKVIPGHFATAHSHINYYLDMTTMKSRASEAEQVARAMVDYYNIGSKIVDTIVCMDGCEVIGAFLAKELSKAGILSTNQHKTIYVIKPEYDPTGQIIFRDNIAPAIRGKHVLLLLASATTGKTVKRCLNVIRYYGGTVSGISAIFSAVSEVDGYRVDTIFSSRDIPDYASHPMQDCPMCQQHQKIDAIVNGFGYSRL